MREWMLNVWSAVFNTQRLTIRKDQAIDMNTLKSFLSLLPDEPVAKVIDTTAFYNMVEFRFKMPKAKTPAARKRIKRRHKWAGGKTF